MFFDNVSEMFEIAKRVGFSIFVIPKDLEFSVKNAIVLKPEEKSVITIEQVQDVLLKLSIKQTEDFFVIIRPADALGREASNALLKNLEEPKEKVHFVLVTDTPSKLLETILSRAAVYFLREKNDINEAIKADKAVVDLARKFVVAKPSDLPALAEEVAKKKDGVRAYALSVIGTAIEILYKSYFKTGKIVFAKKIPKFLEAYENIEKNGHIKLHLVADLL